MENKQTNPLQGYFRQPAIYVKLPSGGANYPAGTLDLPSNGEIPIYPMTAMDEVATRTPDALFNGSAVAQLIQSCVPNIKDPWAVPQVDIDLLFTAIRIASYGHEMDMTVKCPKCGDEQDFGMDLRTVIDQYGSPDFNQTLQIDDLTFSFRPLRYSEMSEIAKAQFEQQKKMQLVSADESAPQQDKINVMSETLAHLTKMTMESMIMAVTAIKVGEQVVTDRNQITEFMNNADRKIFNKVREFLTALRSQSEMKPLKIKCRPDTCGDKKNCPKEFEQPFTLDMSNFFAQDS